MEVKSYVKNSISEQCPCNTCESDKDCNKHPDARHQREANKELNNTVKIQIERGLPYPRGMDVKVAHSGDDLCDQAQAISTTAIHGYICPDSMMTRSSHETSALEKGWDEQQTTINKLRKKTSNSSWEKMGSSPVTKSSNSSGGSSNHRCIASSQSQAHDVRHASDRPDFHQTKSQPYVQSSRSPSRPSTQISNNSTPCASHDQSPWSHSKSRGSSTSNTLHRQQASATTQDQNTSIQSEGLVCRICHEGDSHEVLVSPCYCAGSVGLLHVSCLQKWLGSSNKTTCEICHFEFTLERKTMPLKEFFRDPGTSVDKRNLCCDLVSFVLITPITIAVMGICLHGAFVNYKDTLIEKAGLLSLASALIVMYLIWITIAARHNWKLWKDWKMFHQEVTLMCTPVTIKKSLSLPNVQGFSNYVPAQSSKSTHGTVQLQSIKVSVHGPISQYKSKLKKKRKEEKKNKKSSSKNDVRSNSSKTTDTFNEFELKEKQYQPEQQRVLHEERRTRSGHSLDRVQASPNRSSPKQDYVNFPTDNSYAGARRKISREDRTAMRSSTSGSSHHSSQEVLHKQRNINPELDVDEDVVKSRPSQYYNLPEMKEKRSPKPYPSPDRRQNEQRSLVIERHYYNEKNGTAPEFNTVIVPQRERAPVRPRNDRHAIDDDFGSEDYTAKWVSEQVRERHHSGTARPNYTNSESAARHQYPGNRRESNEMLYSSSSRAGEDAGATSVPVRYQQRGSQSSFSHFNNDSSGLRNFGSARDPVKEQTATFINRSNNSELDNDNNTPVELHEITGDNLLQNGNTLGVECSEAQFENKQGSVIYYI